MFGIMLCECFFAFYPGAGLIGAVAATTAGLAFPANAGVPMPAAPAARQLAGSHRDLAPVHGMVIGQARANPGAVTGRVRDIAGRPLVRICVTATGYGRRSSALTTSGGRFLIPGLRSGSYILRYSDCTSSPRRYFDQWPGGPALPARTRPVRVGAGETVRAGLVTLRPVSQTALIRASDRRLRPTVARSHAVNISGTARNRAGRALKGICDWAYPPGNYFAGVGVVTSRTGTYSYAGVGLVPGRYLVLFTTGCGNRATLPRSSGSGRQLWRRPPCYICGPASTHATSMPGWAPAGPSRERSGPRHEAKASGVSASLSPRSTIQTCISSGSSPTATADTCSPGCRPAGTACSSLPTAATPAASLA